jgi:dihydrodipicolinate synthase/N-acetylneuraminate lyase
MPSCLAPDLHGKIFDLWQAGQRDEARRVWNRLLPLVFWRWHTSAQEAGKLYLKHLGVFETSYTRPDHGQLKLARPTSKEMLRVLEELGQ